MPGMRIVVITVVVVNLHIVYIVYLYDIKVSRDSVFIGTRV